MTTQEIRDLPTEEKLQIMEAIWDDLKGRYEKAPISPEILALLRQRQERVTSGEARLLDWDQVKFAVGRG